MFNWLKSLWTPSQPTQPTQPNDQTTQGTTKDKGIELTTYHENWSVNQLDPQFFSHIFSYLTDKDIMRCRLVCRTWKKHLDNLPELTVTIPNPKYSSLFRNIERLYVDPMTPYDCQYLVTRLSNLTSLKCPKIAQDVVKDLVTLKKLECPNIKPPFSVQSIVDSNPRNVMKYTQLTSLEIINLSDKDTSCLGKLTTLQKLTINSKRFTGVNLETLVDVSHLTSLELVDCQLHHSFFYNLYLFPKLVFMGFNHCQLPITGISTQTPLSQLPQDAGFVYILGCNALRYLYLNNNNLKDYHLNVIGQMKYLYGLSVKGCQSFSDYSLNQFKDAPLLRSIEELNISETMVTHIGLQIIQRMKYLRVLDISRCHGIKILTPLNSLKNLEILRLSRITINADILQDGFKTPSKYIQQLLIDPKPIDDPLLICISSKFPNLVSLNLRGSKITSEGCALFETLNYLRYVDVSETKVDDTIFEKLAECKNLEVITMEDCEKITGEGVGVLKKLRGLRVINMNGCKNFLEYSLKEMENLSVETLRLQYCENLGMLTWKLLSKIEQLKRVDLSHTKVNDANIEEILNAKWLEAVFLKDTNVTDVTVQTLLKCNLVRKIDARKSFACAKYRRTNCIILLNPKVSEQQKVQPVIEEEESEISEEEENVVIEKKEEDVEKKEEIQEIQKVEEPKQEIIEKKEEVKEIKEEEKPIVKVSKPKGFDPLMDILNNQPKEEVVEVKEEIVEQKQVEEVNETNEVKNEIKEQPKIFEFEVREDYIQSNDEEEQSKEE